MAKVTIYSTPICGYCQMAKQFFKEKGVEFEEFDVLANLEKRQEMIDKTGQMGVPVITVDDEVVIGFDQPMLEKLLKI